MSFPHREVKYHSFYFSGQVVYFLFPHTTHLFPYSSLFSLHAAEDARWRPDCQPGLTRRTCHLINDPSLDDVLLHLQGYPSGEVTWIWVPCGVMHLPLLMRQRWTRGGAGSHICQRQILVLCNSIDGVLSEVWQQSCPLRTCLCLLIWMWCSEPVLPALENIYPVECERNLFAFPI